MNTQLMAIKPNLKKIVKRFLIVFSVFNTTVAFSQDVDIENFINEVYTDLIPYRSFEYYYLKDEPYKIKGFLYIEDDEIKSLLEQYPDINREELNRKLKESEDTTFNWSIYNLKKARKCNYQALKVDPHFMNRVIYSFVKKIFQKRS